MRNDKPSILILGASQMQLPAIYAAKELGWTVIVADADASAPGAALADYFEHVDLKDREGMTLAAIRHREAGRLDGVFTAGTDFSTTVAWVAEKLSLPGISYETALNASDKARMRTVFHRKGIASPAFVSLTPGEDPLSIMESLQLPLVIKPVDSMGARGVRRVDTEAELSRAVADAFEHSRSGRVIVEQYIEGPEFSLDAIIYKGSISLCGIADRHISFPPYFVEMGHTMPTLYDESAQQKVINLFFEGIRALGIDNGAAKGDIKLSKEGPVVGEIAARLSGGYMSGWTYPYSSGIRVTEEALKIAVGLPPGNLVPVRHRTAAERAFISIPGVVAEVESDVESTPGLSDIFYRVDSGDTVTFPTNNVEKCGSIIAVDDERERAAAIAEKARRAVFLRLVPFAEKTRSFLFGHDYGWVPDAFSLTLKENLRAYEKMAPACAGLLEAVRLGKVAALPVLEAEASVDWHGEHILDAFGRVLRKTGFETVSCGSDPAAEPAVGKLFWKAFLRGGVQGGVWILDSLVKLESERDKHTEVLHWLN